MRRKEHEAMVRVMKDQADAILTLKNAVQALTKVNIGINVNLT